ASTRVPYTTLFRSVRGEHMAAPRLTTMLLGLFAVRALAISIAGVAGVIAFTVSQRTRDIGIRIALGADGRRVLWLVGRQALTLALAGLALGAAGALALNRFIAGWLYGVSPGDPLTYAGVALLLLAAAGAAAYAPARRATRVDPITALRNE